MRLLHRQRMIILGILAFANLLRAAPSAALGDGESLTYKVAWAILPGVGEITVNAHAATDASGSQLLRIMTHTATRGVARLLLPFDARAESLFDLPTDRLLSLSESSSVRSKKDAHSVSFSYTDSTATYVDTAKADAKRILPMPPGLPTDLITCLLQARTWGLRPGQARDALVLFEDEFYELTVHAVGLESVDTHLGRIAALVLEPRMEKTPPKGMFKRGSTVKVWVSEDTRRLPVKFRVDFKVGAGVATLESYHPPAPAPTPRSGL
jgi:hypothetical protein